MRDMLDTGRGRLHVAQQKNSTGHVLTVPSGVYLITWTEIPGGLARAWAGDGKRLRSATIERERGHPGLAHFGEEYPSVLLADAVRDDLVVERLLLSEHLRSSLVLAPRAHDGHRPASVAAILCNHVRFATDPSQSGLSLHRRVEHPAGAARAKALAPGTLRRY